MILKRLSNYLVLLLIGVWSLTSCQKEAHQAPELMPSSTGDSVRLSISAEIGFEEASTDLRNLKLKLESVDGKQIPRPQLADGDSVEVHTIIRQSKSPFQKLAKTLKWRYNASKRSLVLSKGSFEVSDFNDDDPDMRWYISALLAPGTRLSGTSVEIAGTRELREITVSGGDLSHLNVPYYLGWTELEMDTKSERDERGSYREGGMPITVTAKFKPLGALLAYRLGNKQSSGVYTFTPTSFMVSSNAYFDKGKFELNTHIPSTNPQNQLPYWTALPSTTSSVGMSYTFATGHAPGVLTHNAPSSKVYYAWVMPTHYHSEAVRTHIMLKGTSSRPETSTYKDYTKTYYTDYTTVGKVAQGRPQQGKIHGLKANATHRLALPIEYVTERNLAGGVGFASNPSEQFFANYDLNIAQSFFLEPLSPLSTAYGSLRFASSDSNDDSGYYNQYVIHGIEAGSYRAPEYNWDFPGHNPAPAKNLQDEIQRTWPNTYFIPDEDHWTAVFPPQSRSNIEYLQYGYDTDATSFMFGSDYSSVFTTNDQEQDAVMYAIRFNPKEGYGEYTTEYVSYADYSDRVTRRYSSLMDNSLRCAYRYTRVGGRRFWSDERGIQRIGTRLKVDVVYLGDTDFAEEGKSPLETISNQAWWDSPSSSRHAKGLVQTHTRIFPATGNVNLGNWPGVGFVLFSRDAVVSCASRYGHHIYFDGSLSNMKTTRHSGSSVRLFRRRVD